MLHGIYGAGGNLRGVARKLVERRPDWGVVLVDLRGHGRSELGDPPHDLAACVGDLRAVVDELGGAVAIAGHSFGGKVALAARAALHPRQTWMLDATPGVRPPDPSVLGVLALLGRAPWTSRDQLIAAAVADGHAPAFAQWLAMNVVDGRLRLDVAATRALLADYFARDLWSELEAPDGDVEVVIGDRSTVVTADDQRRLAAAPAHVHVHHVDAGHWLHVDATAAVVALFAEILTRD